MLGFIGLGARSTVEYIATFNRLYREKCGERSSCPLVCVAPNFETFAQLQQRNDWDQLHSLMIEYAKKLQLIGASCIVIGANTMHKSVEFMRKSEECPPIIHIATAVAEACVTDGVKQVGLLGTAWTMENALYIGELATRGVTTVVPLEAQRKRINDIIYSQLCKQIVRQEDASYVQDVVLEFMVKQHGCTAIIMGCTELPLLGLDSSKVGGVKCYNTTEVHAQAAINFLLRK